MVNRRVQFGAYRTRRKIRIAKETKSRDKIVEIGADLLKFPRVLAVETFVVYSGSGPHPCIKSGRRAIVRSAAILLR